MYATLSAGIRDLLLEDGRACLPGVGTLIVEEQPAVISLMESRAAPPSALLTFNENLVVDDGRLKLYLIEHDEDPDLLGRLRQQIDGGRTVLLDGVGKLYPGGRKEICFTPVADNFSKTSFGLPTVKLAPIVRKEKMASTPNPTARQKKRTNKPRSVRVTTNTDYRKLLGLTALLLLLLTAGFFALRTPPPTGGDSTATAKQLPPVDASRIGPEEAPKLNLPQTTVAVDPVQPEVSSPIVSDTAIIAIGLYGRQRNVNKVVGRLTDAGYQPYTDRAGRNTRVGAKVSFESDASLQSTLTDIRENFAPEAFVMRVNGSPRRPK